MTSIQPLWTEDGQKHKEYNTHFLCMYASVPRQLLLNLWSLNILQGLCQTGPRMHRPSSTNWTCPTISSRVASCPSMATAPSESTSALMATGARADPCVVCNAVEGHTTVRISTQHHVARATIKHMFINCTVNCACSALEFSNFCCLGFTYPSCSKFASVSLAYTLPYQGRFPDSFEQDCAAA